MLKIENELENNYFLNVNMKCDQEQLEIRRLKYSVRNERNETRKQHLIRRIQGLPNKHCKLLADLKKQLGYN